MHWGSSWQPQSTPRFVFPVQETAKDDANMVSRVIIIQISYRTTEKLVHYYANSHHASQVSVPLIFKYES